MGDDPEAEGTSPIEVPEELRALVAHRPEVLEALRTMRVELEAISGLSERDIELARIGAAIGLGAPPATFKAHIERAITVGATSDDIWGVVLAVTPLVGVPKLLACVPAISEALGKPG